MSAEDYRCCALRDGHDGCCAVRCGTCNGQGGCTGPCYGMDDLGCDECGGSLACSECGGSGWFNEDGDPCMVPTADELPPKEVAS